MKCVADTNVLAYFLLKTQPFYEESQFFWRRAGEVWAPDSWRIEFLNTLWLAVRQGVLGAATARRRMMFAERLMMHTCSVAELKNAALHLAIRCNHPAYDTVFLALAIQEEVPLATYDKKVLDRFPNLARRPAEIG